MNSVRRPVKNTSDSKRRWRDKFEKQCTDRMKNARQDKISKIREDQWMQNVLKNEWECFKKENENAMRQEGIIDMDGLIKQSLHEQFEEDDEYYLRQEQEELENAMYFYEESINSTICVNCQKAALVPSQIKDRSIATCPNCSFYTTETCLADIVRTATEHGTYCQGSVSYSLEPGTDNTIVAICNICDLWNMFYL